MEKIKIIKCPLCHKGDIEIIEPFHNFNKITQEHKKVIAQYLKKEGYSIRQIMRFLGYKSPQSVQLLLR